MFKQKIGTLAVTSITIVAAALLTLSTTAAGAAATKAAAPGHIAAPRAAKAAADPSGCVTESFDINDQYTYEQCVAWEQVLLNNLWYFQNANGLTPVVNQLLATDGHYGPDTTSDVEFFQTAEDLQRDGITGPKTWYDVCSQDLAWGFEGVYWHDAGCATEPGLGG
jgi:peptidoglycan hydrolase-like protein with peptidoglycan-binding domain